MVSEGNSHEGTPAGARHFATTHWSVVLCAGQGRSADSEKALATLCQTYWLPLYTYARRKGSDPHDAEDLTQEFFSQLFENGFLQLADQNKGRFRSYLLTAFNRFLARKRVRASALKRGGRVHLIPLDIAAAEGQCERELTDPLTPERAYDRRWALTLLETVLARLREECVAAGKGELFDALRETLAGERTSSPYHEMGRRLGLSEAAVKVAVHRFRKRYRELLRDEVIQTVSTPAEVEAEMRALFEALQP